MKKHPDEFPIVYALSSIPTLIPDRATAKAQIVRIRAVLRRLERAVQREDRKVLCIRKGGDA